MSFGFGRVGEAFWLNPEAQRNRRIAPATCWRKLCSAASEGKSGALGWWLAFGAPDKGFLVRFCKSGLSL